MSLTIPVKELFEKRDERTAKHSSWEEIELKDAIKIQNGFPFESNLFTVQKTGMPLIRIRDILNNKSNTYYSGNYDPEFIVKEGDLLVGMDGDFNSTIWTGEKGLLNQRVCRLIVNESILLKKFLYYGIGGYLKKINDNTSSVTVKHLSSNSIKEIPFPLPPLPEQKRIVAKLDTLFAHLDQLKARLQNIPILLKQFRQAVLTQAVTGKLTEEWREGRGLTEVVIKKVRKEGKILITDRVSEYKLVKLPDYWNWRIISEVADVKGGKRLPKGEMLVSENTGLPYIKAGDLKNGTVLIDQLDFLLPKTQEKIKRYIVNKGDVYITNVGACIGDAGIIPDEMDNANLTENALKLCNHEGVFNFYLSFWLRSPVAQAFIKKTILSGAQGKLALGRVETFPIPLPPFEEQEEIVRRIELLFAVADRIEASYKTFQEKIDHLPQAILSKAFRGALVPQDNKEVPATTLLKSVGENVDGIARVLEGELAMAAEHGVKFRTKKDNASS